MITISENDVIPWSFVASIWGYAVGALLLYYVVNSFFMMKLFAKANVPAWKAWVPFVNTWKFFELGGFGGGLSLLFLTGIIPCIGWIGGVAVYIINCMAAYQITLKNGESGAWVLLYVFFPIAWMGVFGLGGSTWNDVLGRRAEGTESPPAHAIYR